MLEKAKRVVSALEGWGNKIQAWTALVSVLGGASALFAWVASFVPPISQYGWGAMVLVGVVIASILALAASALMVGWRRFRPLPPVPAPATSAAPTKQSIQSVRDDIGTIKSDLKQRTEDQTNINRVLDGTVGQVVARTETLAHLVKEIKEQAERDRNLVASGFLRLARSIRARDAEALIKEADIIVLEIGNRLKDAKQSNYENEHVWLRDYKKWTKAVGEIDDLITQWQDTHKPFLDIRRADYEESNEAPPPHISSNATLTPYKTLCFARNRYLSERMKIMAYFDEKARDLP